MFLFALLRRGHRIVTLYESDRLSRETWEAFRARCAADGEPWIDVLRRLLEGHAQRREAPPATD